MTTEDPVYLEIVEEINRFRTNITENIQKEQQKRKACKLKNVMDSKMAQEMKLNADLEARLAELSRRDDDLDRICANFASGLTIADRDRNRLDNAKEMLEIGKKLTGIRFDFSAPPNVAKGYIKSEQRRILLPFEVSAGSASEAALWALVQGAGAGGAHGKENQAN